MSEGGLVGWRERERGRDTGGGGEAGLKHPVVATRHIFTGLLKAGFMCGPERTKKARDQKIIMM